MAKIIAEKEVLKVMKQIGVDKGGLKYIQPKAIFMRILLKDVKNYMANIIKQEMLSFGGDAAVNKGCVNCKAEKSDVLIIGTLKQINQLVEKMKKQVGDANKISKEIEIILRK